MTQAAFKDTHPVASFPRRPLPTSHCFLEKPSDYKPIKGLIHPSGQNPSNSILNTLSQTQPGTASLSPKWLLIQSS